MFKIDGAGSVGGAFVDEDISMGQQPTAVTAEWLNAVQGELVALVEANGGTLSKSDTQQAAKSLIDALRVQRHTAYTTTGTGSAYVVSTPHGGQAITALIAGLRLRVKFHVESAASATFYVVGATTPALKQYNNLGAKVAASVAANQLSDVEFDGVDWVVLGALPPVVFLPGMSMKWASATPPSGWLMRNGAAISRSAYDALFAVIGTTFGAGNGSTTFNLPDDRDRMSIGAGNLYAVGAAGGSKDAIVVNHTHTATDTGHTHTYGGNVSTTSQFPVSGGGGYGGVGTPYMSSSNTNSANANIFVGFTGSNAAGANLPPYLAEYGIIKY